MPTFSPDELATHLGSGLLSFPVTHFTSDLALDVDAYRAHIERLGEYDIAGLFAAGGTGEFFSLTAAEVDVLVRAAVASAPAGTPVLAPAGMGAQQAISMTRNSAEAGADGILLFPPYLTESTPEGLEQYVRSVCHSTDLGVVIYNRANAVYPADVVARLAESCPNLVGFKDGVGDLEAMTRVHAALGDRLVYIGGLPTAELFAMPYLELGVTTYSSAIFNFLPEFALAFYAAVRRRDSATVQRLLNDVVLPYVAIRDRSAGYGVSIVKAGMKAVGHPAGPVRPPLTDLDDAENAMLAEIVAVADAAVAGLRTAAPAGAAL